MVMDIVKKNLVSILCGVVAIICVILIYFPFGGMYEELASEVGKGQQIGNAIENIRKAERSWPTLSPNEEDKVPLTQFPTQQTVDLARHQTDSWTRDADQFLAAAIERQRSRLQLLVPGSLPGNAVHLTLAYEFMDKYRKAFGLPKVGAAVSNPGVPNNTTPGAAPTPSAVFNEPEAIFNTIIKATLPPTEAEVQWLQQQAENRTREQLTKRDDRGQVMNLEEVNTAVARVREDIGLQTRVERAKKATVYLDPVQVFKPSPTMNRPVAPNPNEIFEAQVGLWIQQEICHAIRDINADAQQGIIDAPLKRVLDLNFTVPYYAVPHSGPPGEPLEVPQREDVKVTRDYTRNPLGHISGEFYDVIHFQLSFICEADRMPEVLTRLSANRYMMAKRVEMQSVDSALAFAQGFVYGSKPVVQLNIEGQYLILRKFIAPFMPQDIVRGLTAQPGQPGEPGM